MHVLFGALIGAIMTVGATVVVAAATGKRPTAEQLIMAALGGAVAGGFAAATLGAGGAAAAGMGRQVVAFAGGGAAGATTEQAGRNVLDGRPIHEGLDRAAAFGAVNGTIALGVTRTTVAVGRQVVRRARLPRMAASITPNLGNVVTRAYERSARPLTGRSLREVEREQLEGGEAGAASSDASPAPAAAPPAPAAARPAAGARPRSRGFAGALSEAFPGS